MILEYTRGKTDANRTNINFLPLVSLGYFVSVNPTKFLLYWANYAYSSPKVCCDLNVVIP